MNKAERIGILQKMAYEARRAADRARRAGNSYAADLHEKWARSCDEWVSEREADTD